MIPVYIGYDHVESAAFWTCASSIVHHSSKPVQIIPLVKNQLPLERGKHPKQSNEFAFTRFLVPYLNKYQGHAIFIDCDFVFQGDIADLWYLRDESVAIQVCKHSTETFRAGKKYLGTEQTVYPKKCWSSLMLFNCRHEDVKKLTPDYIDHASGLDLHQFKWTTDDQIGELDIEWNWLVGHYSVNEDAKALHFTEGGPYFKAYSDSDHSHSWWTAYNRMKHVKEGLT